MATMILKEFGRTGLRIPELGLGTFGYTAGPEPLRRGLESGALFIDTAESYGTETVVGQALRGLRDRVFLATKVSPDHFGPDDFRRSVDSSLLRLGVDTIDLLQLHYPNPAIPIADTMGALARLIDAGKVRFGGVSNFSVDQLRDAQKAFGPYAIVSNQVRYNLIDRTIESGLLAYCRSQGVAVIAYSPFSKALPRILDCDPDGIIADIGRETGKTAAQIVLNWCLCQDAVFAIPKGNSVEHILENCAASGWRLTQEQIKRLDMKIRYRRRTRFDELARKWMPHRLQQLAVRLVENLPRNLRRRLR